MIFQWLPCRFWSILLVKQQYRILLFYGIRDLKITSSKNDLSNNKDFYIAIVKAWLDSWVSNSNIFILKKIGFEVKNLPIRLYDFSLLSLDLHWVKKKAYQKYQKKILWNSLSGHFKLSFDNTISVNKNMFRFNKATLRGTIANVYWRLHCWLWSWDY